MLLFDIYILIFFFYKYLYFKVQLCIMVGVMGFDENCIISRIIMNMFKVLNVYYCFNVWFE